MFQILKWSGSDIMQLVPLIRPIAGPLFVDYFYCALQQKF